MEEVELTIGDRMLVFESKRNWLCNSLFIGKSDAHLGEISYPIGSNHHEATHDDARGKNQQNIALITKEIS